MSKRYKRPPVDFQDFLDTKIEEGTIPLVVGGKTFHIFPREHLDEDQFKALIATEDPVEVAQIMLDDYDGFKAAGGTTAGLLSLIEAINEGTLKEQGAGAGESAPSAES